MGILAKVGHGLAQVPALRILDNIARRLDAGHQPAPPANLEHTLHRLVQARLVRDLAVRDGPVVHLCASRRHGGHGVGH